MAPAGREAVSKEELAASRAAGRVREAAGKMPSGAGLMRDWRFWVGIIATLSIFSAFVRSGVQGVGAV